MSKNHKMIGACLSVLMLLGALSVVIARIRAAAGSAEEVRRVASSDSRAIVVKTASQGLSRSNSLEMERVTITPRGFEPNVITHAPGRFLLAVDNRSGHDDLTLHLDGETSRLHSQPVSRSRASWREVLELVPGAYMLREANHPQWSCRITIAAN